MASTGAQRVGPAFARRILANAASAAPHAASSRPVDDTSSSCSSPLSLCLRLCLRSRWRLLEQNRHRCRSRWPQPPRPCLPTPLHHAASVASHVAAATAIRHAGRRHSQWGRMLKAGAVADAAALSIWAGDPTRRRRHVYVQYSMRLARRRTSRTSCSPSPHVRTSHLVEQLRDRCRWLVRVQHLPARAHELPGQGTRSRRACCCG